MVNPGAMHWAGTERVLHYLNRTQDLGITYTAPNNPNGISITPVGYCDADFAGNVQLQTTKAHLFCGCQYSYLGHDRDNSRGSEMLENIYLECTEEIGTNQSS